MKKGFTLIELLAVIVVLAVIALIATPVVLSSIQTAKESANLESARGISKAAEFYCASELLGGNVVSSVSDVALIDYKGTAPDSINITLDEDCKATGMVRIEGTNFNITPTGDIEIVYVFVCGDDLVDSRDDKTYKTVQIGDQCWFAEDLTYTTTECLNEPWDEIAPHNACRTFTAAWGEGVYYQWGAAMNGATASRSQGLCPEGWLIPSSTDWSILNNYVGSSSGTKLKDDVNWNGTNTVGFSALPTGYLRNTGSVSSTTTYSIAWSSTITLLDTAAWRHVIVSSLDFTDLQRYSHPYGHPVRCLKGA